MFALTRVRVLGGLAATTAVLLASCAAPPPPRPAPPPSKVVTIPPRPVAPAGASDSLKVPPLDTFGVRKTVNYRLSPAQTTWNLRSAFNVAALNCLGPKYEPIVVSYRTFLKSQAKKLKATTRSVDEEFRKKYDGTFRVEQDAYMTQVYNYFALPPTLPNFCDASLVMALEARKVVPAELDAFSARWLPQIETVFEQFYLSFEAYRLAAAQWDAQYGPVYGRPSAYRPAAASAPGMVYGPAPQGR